MGIDPDRATDSERGQDLGTDQPTNGLLADPEPRGCFADGQKWTIRGRVDMLALLYAGYSPEN
jgi:hypothetical protein